MKRILLALGLVVLGVTTAAQAQQGYVIQQPGQMPTTLHQSYGGGYAVQRPGAMTTFINPTYGGGYVYQPPGQMPMTLTPMQPRMPCVPTVYHRC